jgi:uncharacterized protein (DUF4415 family)
MPKYGTPDKENPEWTKEDFATAMKFRDLPEAMQRALSKPKRGPQKAPTKVLVSMRLSPDVLQALRETGAGWQVRADEALRSWVKRNKNGKKPVTAVTKKKSVAA